MKRRPSPVISLAFAVAAFHPLNGETLSPDVPPLMPVFHSSFEGKVTIQGQRSSDASFAGSDPTVEAPNDFDHLNPPYLTDFKIQYLGGDTAQRIAAIEPDPEDTSQQVLGFRIKEANMENRARIQTHTRTETGFSEIRYTFRMRLGAGWKTVRDLPRRNDWFILNEFWNNAAWAGQDYPFRIHTTLSNLHPQTNDGIYCIVSSQTAPLEGVREWQWKEQNPMVSLPVGKWIDCEVYIKEGDAENGRFVFTIFTKEKGLQTIFDVTGYTHHPDDPSPDGIQHYHPMKMYMARQTIEDAVGGEEGALEIYWDDFSLYGKPALSE